MILVWFVVFFGFLFGVSDFINHDMGKGWDVFFFWLWAVTLWILACCIVPSALMDISGHTKVIARDACRKIKQWIKR